MTTGKPPLTRLVLIGLLGDVITEVDVLRSNFDREDTDRKKLDNLRDELDTYQRKLVRVVISDNTDQFKELSLSLKGVEENLRRTIDDVDKTAQTLENLVKFVGVAQKIAELAP